MSGVITRGRIVRADLANWDGLTATYSRIDATGGTTSGLTVGNEVDVLQVYGGGTARTRATLADAVQRIGSSRKVTLVLAPGTWTIDAALTIPSNIALQIPRGCLVQPASGVTLTINGPIVADDYQIFDVSASGSFAGIKRAFVEWYGATADGTTDDKNAIQAAFSSASTSATVIINRAGPYRLSGAVTIATAKTGMTIVFGPHTILEWDDASIVGLTVQAQKVTIYGGNLRSDNSGASPLLTALKNNNEGAYFTSYGLCTDFCAVGMHFDDTYVVRVYGGIHSNSDTMIKTTTSEGSVADILFHGVSIGTTFANKGSNACVSIATPTTRLEGCYWETQEHTKASLLLATNSQTVHVTGRFENSGEVVVQNSVRAHMNIQMVDSYDSSDNRSLRVDSGGSAWLDGGSFELATLDGTKTAASVAGSLYTVPTVDVLRYGVGYNVAGGGVLGGSIRSCTTGITLSSGATAIVLQEIFFSGNTTNITNSSGGSAVAPGNFTGTLTGCTTSPTGTFRYEVNNGFVTLTCPGLTATSNTTACTITGLPAAIQPSGIAAFGSAALVTDNGTTSAQQCSVSSDTLTLYVAGSATGFTNSGTKGIQACVITYRLRNV